MMPSITRRQIEAVASLDSSKHRRLSGHFKAEGTKCVLDIMPHFNLVALYCTPDWIAAHPHLSDSATITTRGDLCRMSSLSTPSDVIAVVEIPTPADLPDDVAAHQLILALDTIQDPGNLGTIIRVADWFGIEEIICSRETADCYSPKVIQATMGSIARVNVRYVDSLSDIILQLTRQLSTPIPVYGTFLHGKDIDRTPLTPYGIIIIGNEGRGISPQVADTVTCPLTISSYPPGRATAESLNAAVAAAITISKFRAQ